MSLGFTSEGGMRFSATCPWCGKEMSLKDKYAGKKIMCPFCQEPFKAAEDGAKGSSRSRTKRSSSKLEITRKSRKSGSKFPLNRAQMMLFGGGVAVGVVVVLILSLLMKSSDRPVAPQSPATPPPGKTDPPSSSP